MPEPYRRLLVHDRDMTPTMEAAYDRKMNLRVLKYALDQEVFSRQILLIPEGSETPVVFGAIKIYLDEFPAAARDLVLERGSCRWERSWNRRRSNISASPTRFSRSTLTRLSVKLSE